jgi:hypothetical protein
VNGLVQMCDTWMEEGEGSLIMLRSASVYQAGTLEEWDAC